MVVTLAGWGLKLAAGLAAGLVVRAFSSGQTEANHINAFDEDNVHLHVLSITTQDVETFCVRAGDVDVPPYISQEDAVTKITAVLSDPAGWEQVIGVDFEAHNLECTQDDPEYDEIEIRYLTSLEGCGFGSSCISGYVSPQFNQQTGHLEYMNEEVMISNIHLDTGCIAGSTSCWMHTINHETGHVLGLADPGSFGGTSCLLYDSVMHNKSYGQTYGCPNWPDHLHPTPDDLAAVALNIPDFTAEPGPYSSSCGRGLLASNC